MLGVVMNYRNYLLELYRPPLEKSTRVGFICLNKNEPPFSAFDKLDGLLEDSDFQNLRAYPDPYDLYENLSNYLGVSMKNLLITHGSEQAIKFVFDTFLDEKDEVVYPTPSFAMFDVFSYYNKAKIKYLHYDENRNLNIKYILKHITQETKLFVLANPNNPTGTAFTLRELEILAKHTLSQGTIFLLDEAYFHYFNINSIDLIQKFNNLIITRTFSKAWGLAGLRVGYVVSDVKNIEIIRKQKPIDEIGSLSKILCLKALKNSEMILEKNIQQVFKWKNIFKLAKLKDMTYIETEGNFILLHSNKYSLHRELFLNNKILPKMDFEESCLKECFRLSISTDDVMFKILHFLKDNG